MNATVWTPATSPVPPAATRAGALLTLAVKEARQLMPLVAMLLGVASFLALVLMLSNSAQSNHETFQVMLAFSPAVLLAVGAGSMSVGQEKESHSLPWLSWLPVRPIDLILVKWSVAAAMLFALLVGGSLFVPPNWNWFGYTDLSSTTSIQSIALQSLLLLSTGMATAWALQNTFASLIAVIPVALTPWLLSSAAAWSERGMLPQTEMNLFKIFTAILAVVMSGLVLLFGTRHLRGQTSGIWLPIKNTPTDTTRGFETPPDPGYHLWPAPPADSLSAMTSLWWSHHRWFLILIGTMLAVSGGVLVYMLRSQEDLNQIGAYLLFVVLAPMAAAWMGLASYQSDGSTQKTRFLSDRGVSPTAIWVGRHLPPVIILISWSMLVFAALLFLRWGQSDRLSSLSLLGWTASALIIYGIAQFVSMVFRPIAASVLLALLLSWLGLAALVVAPAALGTPLPLLIIAASLPWIASWVMMADHADDRRGLRFWATAGAATLGFIILPAWPIVPVILHRSTTDAEKIAIWNHRTFDGPHWTPVQFHHRVPPQDVIEPTLSQRVAIASALPIDADSVLRVNDPTADMPRAIGAWDTVKLDRWTTEKFLQHLTLWTAQLRLNADDSRIRQQTQDWFVGLGDIVAAVRRGDSLESQGFADALEIELVRQLVDLRRAAVIDNQFASPLASVLADAKRRQDGRRRSVLFARHQTKREMRDGTYSREFGRTNIAASVEIPPGLWYWVKSRYVDELTDALLTLAAGESSAEIDSALHRLHVLNFDDQFSFDRGPYGPLFRIDAAKSIPSIPITSNYAGIHWSGTWEKTAAELFQSGGIVQ